MCVSVDVFWYLLVIVFGNRILFVISDEIAFHCERNRLQSILQDLMIIKWLQKLIVSVFN